MASFRYFLLANENRLGLSRGDEGKRAKKERKKNVEKHGFNMDPIKLSEHISTFEFVNIPNVRC